MSLEDPPRHGEPPDHPSTPHPEGTAEPEYAPVSDRHYPKLQAPERGWEGEGDAVPPPLFGRGAADAAGRLPRLGLHTLGVALLVFFASLILYIATLAPTVGSGEAARIQTAAVDLDVHAGARSHPLTVAASHLLTRLEPVGTSRLPIGEIAARVNLANALVAALTVLVTFLMCLALLDATGLGSPRGRLLFAAAGAASLALAHAFWARAVVADPVPVNVLLVALITWLYIARMAGRGAWTIILAAMLLGLAITNQRAIAIISPIYLIAGIALLARPPARSEGRAILMLVLALLIGLLPLAYLIGRDLSLAGDPLGNLASFGRRTLGGPFASGRALPPPVSALSSYAVGQSVSFLLANLLAVVGLVVLLVKRGTRRIGLLLLILGLAAKAGLLISGATAVVVWVVVAAWVAAGSAAICRRATIPSAIGLAIVLLALPALVYAFLLPRLAEREDIGPRIRAAVSMPSAGPSTPLHPWRNGDRAARSEATTLLAEVPADAVLVAGTGESWTQTARYLVERDGERPDITMVMAGDASVLDSLVSSHLGERPVVLAGIDPGALDALRRHIWLEPRGTMWLATPRPASLEEADRRFAEGKWWDAAFLYGESVAGDLSATGDPQSLARWAVALDRAGFPELAAQVIERYLDVASDPVRAHTRLGELAAAAGGTEAAERHFAAALSLEPPGAEAEYLKGRVAELGADRDAARAAYERCLELEPGHAGARERLAELEPTEPD